MIDDNLSLASERVTSGMKPQSPFQIGDQVAPGQLATWSYAGLTGKPGKDGKAVRRFKKGDWILEIQAFENRARSARVMSIRTTGQDHSHWAATRERLMRHRQR